MEQLASGYMAGPCVCQAVIRLGWTPEVTVLPESGLLEVSSKYSPNLDVSPIHGIPWDSMGATCIHTGTLAHSTEFVLGRARIL